MFIVAAGALSRFAGLLVGGLRLLQLIAQIAQPLADAVFADPGLGSVTLPNKLRVLPHVHFELVLLRLTQRFAQFVACGILRAGHAARGVRNSLLQLLELVGHFVLFAGQALGLLLILYPLRAEARILVAGTADHFPQAILRIGFLLRQLAGLLRQIVELLRRVLMLHPVQDVASFLQTVGRAALSRGGLLGTAILLALGALHVLGSFLQPVERLLQLRRCHGAYLA